MVVVDLTLAVICFMNECHSALVGDRTPRGTFVLDHQATTEPGYGGDLLVFQEGRTHLWAIHRVYTAAPAERRVERLRSTRAEERRGVTHGCVNVTPDVYDSLLRCCSRDVLVISARASSQALSSGIGVVSPRSIELGVSLKSRR